MLVHNFQKVPFHHFVKEFYQRKFYKTVVSTALQKNLSKVLIKWWSKLTFWKLLTCTFLYKNLISTWENIYLGNFKHRILLLQYSLCWPKVDFSYYFLKYFRPKSFFLGSKTMAWGEFCDNQILKWKWPNHQHLWDPVSPVKIHRMVSLIWEMYCMLSSSSTYKVALKLRNSLIAHSN